jgi:hypothetical protein
VCSLQENTKHDNKGVLKGLSCWGKSCQEAECAAMSEDEKLLHGVLL